MNVTLVYPSVRHLGWNKLGSNYEDLYINHGLTSLAACLKQNGHKVKLLDLREMNGWHDVGEWIRRDDSTEYGISVPTLDFHEAAQTAMLIRRSKPKAHIYAGGPHASICPEQLEAVACFDKIFKGEGEITFPKCIEHPDDFGKVVQCERPNLDQLPIEDREIFNLKKIFTAKSPLTGKPFVPMPFINVISGRGCVYKCGFCKPGEDYIFGKFRLRSLDNFFGEIEYLNNKYKFQTLMIDDDSFTLFPNYTQAFSEIYEMRIRKPFYCQSRADFICRNADIMKRLKQAGLDTVFVGFESGSQRMLDLMQKDTTVEQNYEAAAICHGLGIKMWANFMVGLPTETKEEMAATFKMIRDIKPEKPSGAFFTPIPGTNLYDYCKERDLIVSEDPAVLGSRNPSTPKIKGLDYKWMQKQMYGTTPLWKRAGKKGLRIIRKVL